jgi:excisionase family DNA binding protein
MPKATKIDFAKGKVLSVVDAATEVGVHFTTLYRWIQAGEVAFVTFGDTVFIPLVEVQRLKKERNKEEVTA